MRLFTLPETVKLAAVNGVSWLSTGLSLQLAKDVFGLLALIGSFGVSVASVWWIRKQAQLAEAKAAREERSES